MKYLKSFIEVKAAKSQSTTSTQVWSPAALTR